MKERKIEDILNEIENFTNISIIENIDNIVAKAKIICDGYSIKLTDNKTNTFFLIKFNNNDNYIIEKSFEDIYENFDILIEYSAVLKYIKQNKNKYLLWQKEIESRHGICK